MWILSLDALRRPNRSVDAYFARKYVRQNAGLLAREANKKMLF
jgi:hypothetical protein